MGGRAHRNLDRPASVDQLADPLCVDQPRIRTWNRDPGPPDEEVGQCGRVAAHFATGHGVTADKGQPQRVGSGHDSGLGADRVCHGGFLRQRRAQLPADFVDQVQAGERRGRQQHQVRTAYGLLERGCGHIHDAVLQSLQDRPWSAAPRGYVPLPRPIPVVQGARDRATDQTEPYDRYSHAAIM